MDLLCDPDLVLCSDSPGVSVVLLLVVVSADDCNKDGDSCEESVEVNMVEVSWLLWFVVAFLFLFESFDDAALSVVPFGDSPDDSEQLEEAVLSECFVLLLSALVCLPELFVGFSDLLDSECLEDTVLTDLLTSAPEGDTLCERLNVESLVVCFALLFSEPLEDNLSDLLVLGSSLDVVLSNLLATDPAKVEFLKLSVFESLE